MKITVIESSHERVPRLSPFNSASSIFYVFEPYFPYRKIRVNGRESDARAIASDFDSVGRYIRFAIKLAGK